MKALAEYVVKSLAEYPEAVTVQELPSKDSNALLLQILVAKEDLGKIIGKQGRTAKALRTLACACAAKSGLHLSLEIASTESAPALPDSAAHSEPAQAQD